MTNLPTVPTDDIVIHPRDHSLILGTHGRGIWIHDDKGPLELLTPQVLVRRREFLEALSRAAGADKTKIHVY